MQSIVWQYGGGKIESSSNLCVKMQIKHGGDGNCYTKNTLFSDEIIEVIQYIL